MKETVSRETDIDLVQSLLKKKHEPVFEQGFEDKRYLSRGRDSLCR